MDENKLIEFHQRLTHERINNNYAYEAELKTSYREILLGMTGDYSEYRKHVSKFLSSLEENNYRAVIYSINLFFELYAELIKVGKFKHFDTSIMDYDADDSTFEKMKPVFEASYSKNNQQRMSEDNFDISSLSDEDKKEMASLIIEKLQSDSQQLNWNNDMVLDASMLLIFLRQILASLNASELFYNALGIFFDRLSSSEFYQAGRDMVEEVIISSYKDKLPELGYFNSFRFYSSSGSIHASLFYANLSMTCILIKDPPFSEKYVKEIIWQGIKLFRTVNLSHWVKHLYKNIPIGLKYRDYERRSLDHTYFTSLIAIKEPSLPSILLDYLNKEREQILSGGINEALPWLLTLFNVKRLYPLANFSSTGLGFFLDIFELIVPIETIKKYKDIINADSDDLKKHLKESLIKLDATRNSTDFVYDNDRAITISSRLIEYSTTKKDAASFLLSMMLKSDYSILFQSKESKELAPLILPDTNIETFETLYEDKNAFLKVLPISTNGSANWIAFSEGKLFQLQLFNGEYSFSQLTDWVYDTYKELINSDFFVDLSFSDSIKDKSGVRLVSPEEFKEEENEIAKKISIAKLTVSIEAEAVYIVKDMELSKFPHNLFLNVDGDFIAKNIPITNVLSTEWLLQTTEMKPLLASYSKSIWIPIESGDFTLNYLYSNIEQTLQGQSFEVFTQVNISKPLSSDINIICSHGAKNISEVQIVFQEDKPTYDLDSVIGNGKILIFFVCYSGSMKTEFFRNNVTSLVKRFITQGYEAVIAPFWALDVTIPKFWLPVFLNSFDAGKTISEAIFIANRKVYEQYPTPAAWACLHLYGNPNIKIV